MLAAILLKETKITNLKCAAARVCSVSCQRPLTSCSLTISPLLLVHSLQHNFLPDEAKQAVKDAFADRALAALRV